MKLKITNKRKFKRTVLFITFGMLLILFFTLNNAYSNGEVKYKQEYIYSGDTLWTIAEDEAKNNKYYENKDIRNIISEIKQINNIQSGELKVGQKIEIPTL